MKTDSRRRQNRNRTRDSERGDGAVDEDDEALRRISQIAAAASASGTVETDSVSKYRPKQPHGR